MAAKAHTLLALDFADTVFLRRLYILVLIEHGRGMHRRGPAAHRRGPQREASGAPTHEVDAESDPAAPPRQPGSASTTLQLDATRRLP